MMQKLRICAGFVAAGCGALAIGIAGTYATSNLTWALILVERKLTSAGFGSCLSH
jgi:hypothetical protein